MALIKCPECGREVSDKASACIHCGYPISSISEQKENFTLLRTDYSSQQYVIQCNQCNNELKFERQLFGNGGTAFVSPKGVISCPYCTNTQTGGKIYYEKSKREEIEQKAKMQNTQNITYSNTQNAGIRCPKCNSSSITTGARGVSGFWGFIGASKTVNRCANCGHTWTPRG